MNLLQEPDFISINILPKLSGLNCTYAITVTYGEIGTYNYCIVNYQQSFKYLNDLSNGDYILELIRSAVKINHIDASESMATNLAQRCGEVIYPLKLQISRNAKIVTIANYQSILGRWQLLVSSLQQYFVGELAEDYITETGRTLSDARLFQQAVVRDLFLSVYFAPIYSYYDASERIPVNICYPVGENGLQLDFIVFQMARTRIDNNVIEIRQEGKQSDITNGIFTKSATMEANYTLNRITARIEHLHAAWQIDAGNGPQHVSISATSIVDHAAPE